jgi:hypothetical protein
LRKRRKRKKGKYEYGVELSAEKSEAVEAERETEGDVCLKKCKREKIHEIEGVKTEVDTGHSQSEDDNTPPKKKKRKKSEGSGVEGTEGKMDMAHEDTSDVHKSYDTETFLEKKIKTEVDTGHSQPEDDNTSLKKKKRKKSEGSGVEGTEGKMDMAHEDTSDVHKSYDTETFLEKKIKTTETFLEKKIKTEVDTENSQPEDDNTSSKKKKRKKTEGSGVEGTEGKKDMAHEDTSSVHQSYDTVTFVEKKKQKRKIVDVEDTDVSELQQGVSGVEREDEEVGKKMKIKSVQWNEDVNNGSGTAEETAEEGAEGIVKKKSRKRKKKHKKDKQDVEVSRLQILSKYVTLARMSCICVCGLINY